MKDCTKVSSTGKESQVQIAYIRGSQINFIVLPDMLQKAPFFNRIKLWRKHKGHAVFGTNTIGPIRGQAAAIAQKSRERKLEGMGRGIPPPFRWTIWNEMRKYERKRLESDMNLLY